MLPVALPWRLVSITENVGMRASHLPLWLAAYSFQKIWVLFKNKSKSNERTWAEALPEEAVLR